MKKGYTFSLVSNVDIEELFSFNADSKILYQQLKIFISFIMKLSHFHLLILQPQE